MCQEVVRRFQKLSRSFTFFMNISEIVLPRENFKTTQEKLVLALAGSGWLALLFWLAGSGWLALAGWLCLAGWLWLA